MMVNDKKIIKQLEDNIDKIIVQSRNINPEYKVDADRYLQGYENCKSDLEELLKKNSIKEKFKKLYLLTKKHA